MEKTIKTALISVYYKDGLEEIVNLLNAHNVRIISTGGTADFINKMGIGVIAVEKITGFPSILGGRVKTLHPGIMGGILARRNNESDLKEQERYNINDIDLVIVDLYPFEETVASGAEREEIIEKIDIGGISLIRAAAKNYNDVVIVPSKNEYSYIKEIIDRGTETTEEERLYLAGKAFEVTSQYDSAIREYFQGTSLRYGENPHQKGAFIGDISELWEQLGGKEMSHNNLLDTEAAINLVYDAFLDPVVAIIKHTNACGFAIDEDIVSAFNKAYDADPDSAFGGILATNRIFPLSIAERIDDLNLFLEVVIAPGFEDGVVEMLSKRKSLRIIKWKNPKLPSKQFRSCFNGILIQDRDKSIEVKSMFELKTKKAPSVSEKRDLFIANVIVKNLKSNAIAIVKNGQLIGMGCGHTSRVDALEEAIKKAKSYRFDPIGAVIASEAFFPFPDCAEIAGNAGIKAIIQPGGSLKDADSIRMCDAYNMAMVFTGVRHFKH